MPQSTPKNQQDLLEFVYSCGKISDGVFKSNILWSKNKRSGKFSWWQVIVGLENGLEVIDKFVNRGELPRGAVAYYYTLHAQEGSKGTQSEKSTFDKGNNIGRANFTTALTYALMQAKRLYTVKIKGGHVRNKNDLLSDATFDQLLEKSSSRGDHPWRVFLMALKNVNDSKNWNHVKFPCDLQPKYDGTRFAVVAHPGIPKFKDIGHIDCYSRRKETYEGQDDILRELYPVLRNYPGLYIDGELWKRGFGREDISGSSRRKEDSKHGQALELDFMVFDCFRIEHPDDTWEDRKKLLEEVIEQVDGARVKLVESTPVGDKDNLMRVYQSFLEDDLEGGVIRMLNGKYEFGLVKELRSTNTMKIKPRPDAEWPVKGFKQGARGKEKGLVIWILDHEGKEFSVTPNMPGEKRAAIFKYLSESGEFESEFKGKLMTVSYDRLSATGVPQQPKALYFRDEKVQMKLENAINM